MSKSNPNNTDAILGGQSSITTGTAVLGGIEGIKHLLASKDKQIQVSALQSALSYEEKGLDLLIEIWKNDSNELKWDAFSLLRTRTEEKVKQALIEYNPWLNLKCIHTWEQDSTAISITIAPDGNTLFSGNKEQINVWDMQTKQQKSTSFPYYKTSDLSVTSDGKFLISRGGYTMTLSRGENTCYLFGDERFTNNAIQKFDSLFGISSEAQVVYHSGGDTGIISWNILTKECTLLLTEYSIPTSNFVVTPCERFIIYSDWYSCIKVWNLKTGKNAKNIKNSKGYTRALAISNDGKVLVSGGEDGNVNIWDFKERNLSIVFKHKESVSSVAISPDDRTVVSGSRDKTVKVWDLQTNKIKFTLKGHMNWVYCVAISPDGNYIFSCSSDKTIRVWDLHTGECVSVLTGHTELIHCLVVSPDGKTLISSSRDRTIKVWQRQS
jgi:COMPASS component SWD3